MLGLERLELAEEPVVLRVRDLRRVIDVVGVIGALDLLAEAGCLLCWRHGLIIISDHSPAIELARCLLYTSEALGIGQLPGGQFTAGSMNSGTNTLCGMSNAG